MQCAKQQVVLYFPPKQNDAIAITKGDVRRLEDVNEFLNDNLIDFYFKYMMMNIRKFSNTVEHFFCFNAFFYKRLIRCGSQGRVWCIENCFSLSLSYSLFLSLSFIECIRASCSVKAIGEADNQHNIVQRWTKGFDLFEKDYVFVPIHLEYVL
jgi:ubiquitin-like-specific protease 1C/D